MRLYTLHPEPDLTSPFIALNTPVSKPRDKIASSRSEKYLLIRYNANKRSHRLAHMSLPARTPSYEIHRLTKNWMAHKDPPSFFISYHGKTFPSNS